MTINNLILAAWEINWDKVKGFWETELFSIGDANTKVTVSQLVITVLMLLVGLMVISFLTKLIFNAVVKRSRINDQAAVVIQRLTYYILLSLLVISCLQVAGIPITALTVIGGALAIGVGFGAQNIVNNLISALTLLI